MKILIDIGHPAHVHLFKHFAWEMQKKGHFLFFTCREKEFEIFLLEKYELNYKSFGPKYSSKIGKIFGLLEFDIKEFLSGLKFKPDLFLSCGSFYAAHAAFLLRKPHISLEDTGNWEQVRLYLPFTQAVLTSNTFPISYGSKQVIYNGHHEVAYLHPYRFKPNEKFREHIGLSLNEKYVILRFVSWNATHDIGQKGINEKTKTKLVNYLSKKYKVFISSEAPLPNKFSQYKISFAPDEIHQALFYADLFIGEGTTMAMEAAMLGTPSIYVNSLQYNNIKDMMENGLAFCYNSSQEVYEKVKEIAETPDLKLEWQERRTKMFTEKIDVTAFLIWFIENWPKSYKIMKEKPDYQYNFK